MEDKWIFAMIAAIVTCASVTGVFVERAKSEVQIACYDAMKHNPNIKECK